MEKLDFKSLGRRKVSDVDHLSYPFEENQIWMLSTKGLLPLILPSIQTTGSIDVSGVSTSGSAGSGGRRSSLKIVDDQKQMSSDASITSSSSSSTVGDVLSLVKDGKRKSRGRDFLPTVSSISEFVKRRRSLEQKSLDQLTSGTAMSYH